MAKKTKDNDELNDFIKNVVEGKNVEAKERLEKILKKKTARRIKETLAS